MTPPQITSSMLRSRMTKDRFDRLVQSLSEDVAGAHFIDPGVDDFKELDALIAEGLTEFLLGLELPEQARRGEAAVHEAADRDAGVRGV